MMVLAACVGAEEPGAPADDDEPAAETAPAEEDVAEEAPEEPLCPSYSVLTGDDDNQRSAFYALEEGIVTSDIIGELDIEYTTIPGLIAAVGTGQYDATLSSTPGVVLARAGGVDLRVLGVQLSHTGGGFKMFVREDSDLQSGADLAGRTLGVTAFGSTATIADRIILSQEFGLDSELEGGDVNWVELDPPTLMTALLRGDVDAATLFHNFGWEALENPDLRILVESDTFFREITGDFIAGAAFVVEADQLDEPGGRECAVEFRRMLLESVAYVENNLEEVAEAIAPVSGVPAEFIEYWWQPENHEYGGGIDDVWLDRAQNVWDEAHELGILPEPPDIRDIIIED
jgi:ABC-type nitrate/sulfonate/bicarbonate transport system substrate-binding protein